MKHFNTTLLMLVGLFGMAQFPVGHISINFNDSARSGGTSISGAASMGGGRAIGTEIYYPATTAGNNTPVAPGSFPIVVFGHGFVMTYDAYTTLFDTLTQNGFIVAMVTTEGSISPSHTDFGKDLAKVADEMLLLNAININGSSVSPFLGKLNGRVAIGGHSMGGGATFLADQYTHNSICYFTFGAAETNPSAVTAAAAISKPHLIFSGTYDCVAPPATNQTLMYNALTSGCKQQIFITKGYHCEFADASVTCGFGEGTCITPGGLSSVQQQTRVRAYLEPYLDYYLKGICPAWTKFQNLVDTMTIGTLTQSCNNTVPANAAISGDSIFCQGNSSVLTANPSGFQYLWNDSSTSAALRASSTANYSLLVGNGTCRLPIVFRAVTQLDSPIVRVTQQNDTLSFQTIVPVLQSYWYNSPGTIIDSGLLYVPASAGSYYLVVVDSAGCSGTSGTFNFIATDVSSSDFSKLSLYPNPARSNVHLNLGKAWIDSHLLITDEAGRIVLTGTIPESAFDIGTGKFSKGIYILSITAKNMKAERKLVVE